VPKVTIEYQEGEEVEAREALGAGRLKEQIEDFDNWLRGVVKHSPEDEWPDAEAIREWLLNNVEVW